MDVHVFAVVRIKVLGASREEGESMEDFANRVADEVCAQPDRWMTPVHGKIGSMDVESVEPADEIKNIMVSESLAEGQAPREHWFDEQGRSMGEGEGQHDGR